ncbi:MAG: hypothetical protein RRA45_09120 [Saccharolobus sp.]|jgi:hypothetical protein|uniref:hypothetical protein n=1 Tax=Saccharolobus sp. TaxID=2100761 RepID=UPI0028CCE0C5|nr:hypothetical protein [Saccharolobus sp.]MDT7862359.1 hypothetical protein [Saccharolobus sp.]
MRSFYIFTLELKRALLFSFIILLGISISLIITQIPILSINAVGIVDASAYGIRIAGYVFNFYGKGVPAIVEINYNNITEKITTENGSFNILIPFAYIEHSPIKISINSYFTNIGIEIRASSISTFSINTVSIASASTNYLSMIVVKGRTIIALNPQKVNYIIVNGKIMKVNRTIFTINSQNVSLPYSIPITYYGKSLMLMGLKFHLLAILIFTFALIDIAFYFLLSSFPRGELKEIIRLVGLERIYFIKLAALIPLVLLLSTVPFYLFLVIEGVFNITTLVKYLISVIGFALGTFGLSPFGSKNMIYYSIILGIYIANLTFYNESTYSLLTSLLVIAGYFKLKMA